MKSIYSSTLPYITKTNIEATKDYLNNKAAEKLEVSENIEKIKVEELDLQTEEIEESHYSKDSLHVITKEEQELMDFGTEVHELLEQANFNNFEPTSNMSEKIIERINNFINTDIIKENLNSKMYKEYEFTYTKNNNYSHGIIDLLIERDDKMIIIDYKLKNIDDLAYDKQLNGYREVIKEKTSKNVECYLYSILDNKFREVKE